MQLAHLGVAVFIIGVTVVKGYQTEKDVRMNIGDTVAIADYRFKFNGVIDVPGPNYRAWRGQIEVSKNGKVIREMHPEKREYFVSGSQTEAAIDVGLFRDLYVALGEPVSEGAWSVRVYYKPFIDWIWGGCLLMAIGGMFAVSDRRYRLAARTQQKIAAAPLQAPRATLVTETSRS